MKDRLFPVFHSRGQEEAFSIVMADTDQVIFDWVGRMFKMIDQSLDRLLREFLQTLLYRYSRKCRRARSR